MIDVRRFDTFGRFRNGWLNARHHFSFGGYMDPKRMGWGAVRVWNDDEIAPNSGFDPHPHRDMEIITYVRQGAITHRDNLGNEGRTEAGDVQVMSAGSGIVHAEYNLEDEETRLYQIWILPDASGGAPRWDAAKFPKGERADSFVTLASGDPETDGGLFIRADARVLGASLTAGRTVRYELARGRSAYLGVASGTVSLVDSSDMSRASVLLEARDAAGLRELGAFEITASQDAELVLVDSR